MADKQITAGGLVHEAGVKMMPLTAGWYVLIAGGTSAAAQTIDVARDYVASGLASDISFAIHKAWHEVRWASVEDAALRPLLLNKDSYFEREGDDGLARAAREAVAAAMLSYECDLLVCGFDIEGGHIFSIGRDTDGSIERHEEGWAAIGSGATLAQGSLDLRQVSPEPFNLDLVIYGVLEAKGRAETADGVGYETDGWILCSNKTEARPISPRIIEMLSDVLDVAERWPFGQNRMALTPGYEVPPDLSKHGDWEQALRTFAAIFCE